jgi:hypothetical protein
MPLQATYLTEVLTILNNYGQHIDVVGLVEVCCTNMEAT